MRHVCNGHWNCPQGQDERNCLNRTCPGRFKATNSPLYSNFVMSSNPLKKTCHSALNHTKLYIHWNCSSTYPLPMSSQDHNLSEYIWYWYTTRKHNWFFKLFWSEGKIACQGGVGGLKCRNSSICIAQESNCDGIPDCIFHDDNHICHLPVCLNHCNCLLNSIFCRNISLKHTYITQLGRGKTEYFVCILHKNLFLWNKGFV